MKLPKYADWRNRSVAECSILLTKTQTRQLLALAFKEFGIKIDPYTELRKFLLADGWNVVEKHGDRLFLRAVIMFGDVPQEEIDRFFKHAEQTGNWSFSDWYRVHYSPKLMLVKR